MLLNIVATCSFFPNSDPASGNTFDAGLLSVAACIVANVRIEGNMPAIRSALINQYLLYCHTHSHTVKKFFINSKISEERRI